MISYLNLIEKNSHLKLVRFVNTNNTTVLYFVLGFSKNLKVKALKEELEKRMENALEKGIEPSIVNTEGRNIHETQLLIPGDSLKVTPKEENNLMTETNGQSELS